MPVQDDASISDDTIILRVLLEGWITTKGGRTRPASYALLELGGEGECSGFLDSDTVVPKLAKEFHGLYLARIPAVVLRENKSAIQRKPEECPSNLRDDTGCHVVMGVPDSCTSHQIEQRARRIVKDPRVTVTRLEAVAESAADPPE